MATKKTPKKRITNPQADLFSDSVDVDIAVVSKDQAKKSLLVGDLILLVAHMIPTPLN
jgi:hypothetical protein